MASCSRAIHTPSVFLHEGGVWSSLGRQKSFYDICYMICIAASLGIGENPATLLEPFNSNHFNRIVYEPMSSLIDQMFPLQLFVVFKRDVPWICPSPSNVELEGWTVSSFDAHHKRRSGICLSSGPSSPADWNQLRPPVQASLLAEPVSSSLPHMGSRSKQMSELLKRQMKQRLRVQSSNKSADHS